MDGIMHRGRRRFKDSESTERLRALLGQDTALAQDNGTEDLSLSNEVFKDQLGERSSRYHQVLSEEVPSEPGRDTPLADSLSPGDPHPFLRRSLRPVPPEETLARHREPVAVRARVGRPAFVLLTFLLLVGVVVATVSLFGGAPESAHEIAATDPNTESAKASSTGSPFSPGSTQSPLPTGAHGGISDTNNSEPAQGKLTVHVVGEVKRPSVVEVNAGSRVIDAVKAAGGLTSAAVTKNVNLAQPLTDGQQVVIPNQEASEKMMAGGAASSAGAPANGGELTGGTVGSNGGGVDGGRSGGTGSAGGLINLNSASVSELQTLPRVGPVMAQRIIDFRTQHGPFTSPEQLDDIPGIGPAMLEALLPLVTV